MTRVWRTLVAGVVLACGAWVWSVGGRADDLLDSPAPKARRPAAGADLDDLLDRSDNRTRLRLVPMDDPESGLDQRLYWRTFEGTVAAQVAPVEFRLGDLEVIAPLASNAGKGAGAEPSYPTEALVALPAGKHQLTPGNLPLEVVAGAVRSQHPAVQVVDDKEVRILCAPVRLEVVDRSGAPVPTAVQVTRGQKSPLRKAAKFSSLVLWLPIGGQYDSSFGSFALDRAGKIDPGGSRLAPGVQVTPAGLRRTVDEPAAPVVPAASNSNLVRVCPRGSTGQHPPTLDFLVPPVAPLGGPAWFALSRRQFHQLAGSELQPDHFKAELLLGGAVVPQGTLATRADSSPPAAVVKASGQELAALGEDVVWFSVELPDYLAGPAGMELTSKQFETARLQFLVADLSAHLQLVPHRWRTALAETEQATYEVLIAGPATAGVAQIFAVPVAAEPEKADQPASGAVRHELGTLQLPAVAAGETDVRLFTFAAGTLPCGKYRLGIETAAERGGQVPLEIVDWSTRSPFLLQAMSCCIDCWPRSESGLALLDSFDFQMGTATGHNSLLTTAMPAVNRELAARLSALAPAVAGDLAVQPAANDFLLSRLLRHHIRLIDLTTARGANFYNEGLSYHHSYPPSVARMIRRMQHFTQQTGDYASFWGVNYNWFPSLGGYVEGGVPTDVHTADRMRVLDERLRSAGLEPAAAADLAWLDQHWGTTDPAEQQRFATIAQRATAWWQAEQDQGFGEHNRLYNSKVREVRPQTVCTLFENTGHDAGKRSRALFADMAAACYESYTDFGDWPMSAGFATDWARGNTGGQPVWLTVCWGTSPEATMKNLFHAFARGIQGGGAPMTADMDSAEIVRRGKGLKFLSQYGALARSARPDARVALLSRTARQALAARGMYELHAMYYHLTRLGFPPVLLAGEDLARDGVPAQVELLVLVQEQIPLEAATRQAIVDFQRRGGKLLAAGSTTVAPAGAVRVDAPVKNLWDLGGFEAAGHAKLWAEFVDHWREPLSVALEQCQLKPLAATDSLRALALAMNAGPVRYVALIADAQGTHANEFKRPTGLPLSLAGAGWIVRDLVRQQTLESSTQAGRTELALDLVTEPTTLLALYRHPPAKVQLDTLAAPRLGVDLIARAAVLGTDGASLGATPLACTLQGPDGRTRRQWFAAAEAELRVPLAAHDRPGKWQLVVQELLTGLTATAEIAVAPAAAPAAVQPVGDVHVVDAGHARAFARRTSEKLILVEPGQSALLPLARRLADALNAAGIRARLWQIAPEEFDTIPLRWYPRPEDEPRWQAVAEGRLIGYRENLKPHIDKIKRNHVPELGGYEELPPPYVVGDDCVVFSGGRLCESLRALTPWINTPHVPGRGQGRLLVAFSPYLADKQALAVLANDREGLDRAVDEFLRLATSEPPPAREAAPPQLVAAAVQQATRPVAQPYSGYSPVQRALKLLANHHGQSAVLLEGKHDNLALLNELGQVTATCQAPQWLPNHMQLDAAGRLHGLKQTALAIDPSWHFPTEIELLGQTITADGKLADEMPVYSGDTASLPPDMEAGFAVAPDGRTSLVSRAGRLLAGARGGARWQTYLDSQLPQWRFSVLYPRFAVGSTFSPDGRYVLFTMDSRPPFGGLGTPSYRPTASETVLWDLEQNEPVWRLADRTKYMSSPYAVHSGFAAVANGGQFTALAGFDGSVFLIDGAGKPLWRQEMAPAACEAAGRLGPNDGVGVSMSDQGELAAFAFKNTLLLAAGEQVNRIELPRVAAVAVTADGSAAVVALTTGELQAFDARGQRKWQIQSAGPGTLVAAAGKDRVIVAQGNGELAMLDSQGHEVWRVDAAAAADRADHAVEAAPDFARLPHPADAVEPPTLEIARAKLQAQQTSAWSPSGSASEQDGRKFYELDGRIELSAGGPANGLVHLVYRRPPGNKSLSIAVTDSGGRNEFLLDLPTPAYRVVDIPFFGQDAKIVVQTEGPAQIAEASVWSCQWPGANLCYVQSAGAKVEAAPPAKGDGHDDLDDLLEDAGQGRSAGGAPKTCKIYCPNSDVDRVAGTYLPVPVDPTRIADGKRFEGGKLPGWSPLNGAFFPTRGAFLTIDLGKTASLGLVATYDRALKQSDVARRIVVFTTAELDDVTSGKVLGGEGANDQFWRLFPLDGPKMGALGVHVYSGPGLPAGLSEVEAYR